MCSHESVYLNFCSVNDRRKTKCKIIIYLLARLKHYCSFALWILVLLCCSLGWMKLCEYFWNISKNHPTLKLLNVIFPLYIFFYCTYMSVFHPLPAAVVIRVHPDLWRCRSAWQGTAEDPAAQGFHRFGIQHCGRGGRRGHLRVFHLGRRASRPERRAEERRPHPVGQ